MAPPQTPAPAGDLTPDLLGAPEWTDQMVAAAGIPMYDIPFLTVGGGMGSFVTLDYLRIYGVPTSQMRVVSNIDHPWQTYEFLTRCSQIPRGERIRSDSSSRPDNLWGFPSYALEEAWKEKKPSYLWQILTEPLLNDYWTPRAGTVFENLEREAKRINYWDMLVKGQVRMVRRRAGGGYFTVVTPPDGAAATKRIIFRSRFVHVAIGYPGLKFLPDLQEFRTKHGDYQHVVNAYEPHEQVYEFLKTRPGTVVIRGGGIVASRVLQRLFDDRERHGLQTQIIHIFRTFISGSHGPHIWSRRKGGDGWAYQGFNYPKSVWGGQLKAQMRKLEGADRAKKYKEMGGTNTPYRRRWQEQMRAGRSGGYYHPVQGTVDRVEHSQDGRLVSYVRSSDGIVREPVSDYIIDCTGLEADIAEHRIFADLLQHGGAFRNPVGRLEVERHFEVKGTANGDGALYASGSATLGGYFPGVDTFLGLQIAAQEIADDLARRGFVKKMGPLRSTSQWFKWAFNSSV
ncbi:hypothetical protein OG884_32325 [Streptosporangium sp. NBC_01755]|uniref:hypothetical protein n=1 Tax=unclassified Streptosporangium TaxID=2632669 RepID=UPI002DD7D1FD|nr:MULTISPECIES: hypothetical protein [unclassified Streptosporangium]WSA29092.1 hypothetical protein OIE13_15165 [Streptosporangium sp. NBC_01810]WSC99462.1 hypothetical protein OG884_32325 [Streptosporangium sp. NBC_01755]